MRDLNIDFSGRLLLDEDDDPNDALDVLSDYILRNAFYWTVLERTLADIPDERLNETYRIAKSLTAHRSTGSAAPEAGWNPPDSSCYPANGGPVKKPGFFFEKRK